MRKKTIPSRYNLFLFSNFFLLIVFAFPAFAQTGLPEGFRLAPGRVHLEIPPGGEKTVVLHLQYNTSQQNAGAVRLTTYLNDWSISQTGEVIFQKAGTQPGSAASWMIYSPAEAVVQPGVSHTIRVTVSVPKDAAPGDHLAAVIIEPRSNNIKPNGRGPQFRISFRLAALFYVNVPNATRSGSLENLKADVSADGIQIVPTIKNTGNSAIRPTYSVKVVAGDNQTVFERTSVEAPAVLAQSVQSRPVTLQTELAPGNYKVIYKVNFNDGNQTVEGVTKFTVPIKPNEKIAKKQND